MPGPLYRVASHRWRPEIVIGIDFGMTCTGVAWIKTNLPTEIIPGGEKTPKVKTKAKDEATNRLVVPEPTDVQKWLGLHSMQLVSKVPTELIYDSSSGKNDKVLAWGLYCEGKADYSHPIKRLFKLNIADRSEHVETYGHTTEEARRYFRDYLIEVVAHIDEYMFSRVPDYRALRVEFTFSVPTSWMFDLNTLGEVRRIIREVIGDTQNRRAVIGLSEAAAAAIDIGRGQYKKDDNILVCDIGGGTSDINIVKVMSTEDGIASMKAMTYDEGIEVGSTRIDQAALRYIVDSLGRKLDPMNLETIQKAVHHEFQEIKHEYGTAGSDRQYHLLRLSGINHYEKTSSKHFEGQDFKIPAKELKRWFDEEIAKIIALSEQQIQKLHTEHKKEKISCMVLSGGFGKNQYVRDQLKIYLDEKKKTKDSGIDSKVRVSHANEPQLAVVRGLVYNRAQELIAESPVYNKVCCQQSYGIVVREEYNPKKHKKQPDEPKLSKADGKMWMYGQVDWIIEQGVLIDSTGGKKSYKWILNDGEEHEAWSCELVSCSHSRDRLPRNISHSSIKSVCKVQLDMSKLTVTKMKRGWHGMYSKTNSYQVVEFDLLILIGAADLRFQIHPVGECDTLASLEHEDVNVLWMPNSDMAKRGIVLTEERQPIAGKRKSQFG